MVEVNCKKISVDSVCNDPVDIRCGGPEYLGFDFYVREDEIKEMAIFISNTLNKYGVPLAGMTTVGAVTSLSEDKVWTKERIEACIKKEADYLISESRRGYSRTYNLEK